MRLRGPVKPRFHQLVTAVDGTLETDKMGAMADCPACGRPGLHISYEADGGIALFCHSGDGCDTEAVLHSLEIPIIDLAPDRYQTSKRERPISVEAKEREKAVRGDLVGLRPSFVHMTGYLPGALMLQQILYWEARRGGASHDGHWWIAKSYDQWGVELGITHHEAIKARASLEDLDLIHTQTWLFAGRKVLHYRLDEIEFERLYSNYRPEPV